MDVTHKRAAALHFAAGAISAILGRDITDAERVECESALLELREMAIESTWELRGSRLRWDQCPRSEGTC